jgi:cell wall-associated NlpC family hydrolase
LRAAFAAATCCLLLPVLLIGAAMGSVQVVASASDTAGNLGGGPATDSGPLATAAVSYALAQLGTPYLWGGEGPGGFDCSGLVQAAYASAGIQLPRTAQAQYDAGPLLPAGQQLEAGDLVFYGADANHISHVGILISATEMVDAPHTGADIRTESWRWRDFVAATRPSE